MELVITAKQTAEDERLSQMCKALAHPMRVRILRLLLVRQSCVCGDLVEALPIAQSTVSQHLKVLKEAGLIRGQIDGPRRCYCVSPQALLSFKELTDGLS